MRLHLITNLFAPDELAGAALYTDMATCLQEQGHDVRVTATFRIIRLSQDSVTAVAVEPPGNAAFELFDSHPDSALFRNLPGRRQAVGSAERPLAAIESALRARLKP